MYPVNEVIDKLVEVRPCLVVEREHHFLNMFPMAIPFLISDEDYLVAVIDEGK